MIQAGFNFERSPDSGLIVPDSGPVTIASDGQALRKYQAEAVAGVLKQLGECRSTIVVMPTGSGKTRVAAELIRHWPGRAMMIAHRDELLVQARTRLASETGELVGLEQAQFFAGDERIVVGSVQTLCMPARLERWQSDDFGLIIVDECFPAGTLIATADGDVPIQHIKAGDRVSAWDEHGDRLTTGVVVGTMRRIPKSLVAVVHEHGTLICTANHPVLTKIGWVKAAALESGSMVAHTMQHGEMALRRLRSADGNQTAREPDERVPRVQVGTTEKEIGGFRVDSPLPRMRERGDFDGESRLRRQESGARVLLQGVRKEGVDSQQLRNDGENESQIRFGKNDRAQSDEEGGREGQGIHHAKDHAMVPNGEAWERARAYGTAGNSCGGPGLGDGGCGANAHEASGGISDLLQDRHCERTPESRDRGGREFAPCDRQEGSGREEGQSLIWSRVDRVEVQEQTSDGRFGGLCEDGFVYNFEVKQYHTYVANGLIVHNCHHAPSASYRRVIDHFSGAKIVGITATPDRADEKAMGQVFESVAYVYEIEDAINDGWLCPIRVRQVFIGEINLSACRTTAGDLNQGDLNAAMAVEEALHGVVKATIEQAGDSKTLVFTTSVENAKRLAEIFNRYKPDSARSVDGGTQIDDRRGILAAYKRGEFQYLTNCAIATEGFDEPEIACVAMARPTKSRSLFAQMVGRGLRIHPSKPDGTLILEFTGNSGKHHLASSVDILGGRYEEDEVDAAQEIVKKNPGMRADEALAQAHAEAVEKAKRAEAAKRAQLQAQVQYTTRDFNPFDVFHMKRTQEDEWGERFGGKIASEKQIAALQKFKIDVPKDCTSQQASRLLGTCIVRMKKGLASYGQIKVLTKFGVPALNVSFKHASDLIEAVKRNGWKRPSDDVVTGIVGRSREVGEDG
jgi:superfamily II DNA or RNA helicase